MTKTGAEAPAKQRFFLVRLRDSGERKESLYLHHLTTSVSTFAESAERYDTLTKALGQALAARQSHRGGQVPYAAYDIVEVIEAVTEYRVLPSSACHAAMLQEVEDAFPLRDAAP